MRSMVSDLVRPQDARAERALLHEVFAEAWQERRRQPPGSPDWAFASLILRDLVEQLRQMR